MVLRKMKGWMMKPLFFALFLLLIAPPPARSAEPPKEPMLRIETGMHTGDILRIATDRAGKLLATASRDKTLRIWDIPSGRLLRTLRPPIREEREGELYAVAMSPDGALVATGGWTTGGAGMNYIYVFRWLDGVLVKAIPGHAYVIRDLAWSADGRFLGASLQGDGVRVYATPEFKHVADNRDCGETHGLDFNPKQDRLVVSCFDGWIRAYSIGLDGLSRADDWKAPAGQQPHGIRHSPDGSRIAVAYYAANTVSVMRAETLETAGIPQPDTRGYPGVSLGRVAWSVDGATLYWDASSAPGGGAVIRSWEDRGHGAHTDFTVPTLFRDFVPLADGRLLFAGAEPMWGIAGRGLATKIMQLPTHADFRNIGETFRISRDGSKVAFSYRRGGESVVLFDLSARRIEEPGGMKELAVARTDGLPLTDWLGGREPKLRGKPLPIFPNEYTHSLSVNPGATAFVLGTEWYLRRYDAEGNLRPPVTPAAGAIWAVNITGDGRLVVAALADGTIRWYRMDNGKELLSFFPHNDRKRWILWTPSGYYDASAGAEDLIGWHINNGRDRAADFFPISRFRQQFCRPDVVAKVLETLDEQEAVKLADKEAGRKTEKLSVETKTPPVISIAGNETMEVKTTLVAVPFTVRSLSGEPVTGVSALVSGLPAAGLKGIRHTPKEGETLELSVPVPEQDAEVSIIAENRFARSEPATLRLRWKGEAIRSQAKPTLYILSVGVSAYDDESLKLDYADDDAIDFVKTMQKQKGGIYEEVQIFNERPLTDKEATRDNIVDGLKWLEDNTTSKDTAVIFLSGHGMTERGIYYFLPVMAGKGNLKKTGLAYSEIINTVNVLAGKVVVFVDTCKSGGITGGTKGQFRLDDVVNELVSTPKTVVVYASTTGYQDSREDKAWGHGAFTKAVLECLGGKAVSCDTGKITIFSLADYISRRVKELNKAQTPTQTSPPGMSENIINFTLAVTR